MGRIGKSTSRRFATHRGRIAALELVIPMSNDLICKFDLAMPGLTLERLREQLNDDLPELAVIVEKYRSAWSVQQWTVEDSTLPDRTSLWGPGGFAVRFQSATAEVYHVTRFWSFVDNEELRTPLRRVWSLFAAMFGSRRAIYTHELMPCDGSTLEDIERRLRTAIGPPAETFEQLKHSELFQSGAWYIDDFTDISTPRSVGQNRKRSSRRRDRTKPRPGE
jgi:hypothetical protein